MAGKKKNNNFDTKRYTAQKEDTAKGTYSTAAGKKAKNIFVKDVLKKKK